MASIKLEQTKDGRKYYKIRVRVSRDRPTLTTRWYVPEGWSQKRIDRELPKIAADFELRCKEGEVLSRSEQKAIEEEQARIAEEQARLAELEAAKIKTLRQYGESVFIKEKAATCAEKTRQYYQFALDKHLYPALGDYPLPEITSAQLKAFFLEKIKSGLSHSTVNGIYVTASQLFKSALIDGTITENVLTRVPRPKQKKDDAKQFEIPRFSEKEVIEIKKCLKQEPLKWQALVWILLDTGMRRGEACALTWDKIDFNTMTIRIDGNVGYTPERGVFREAPKTAAGKRDIHMSIEVASVLKRYQAEQTASVSKRKARLEKSNKNNMPLDFKKIAQPVFLFTEKGNCDPIHPDSVNRYFSRFSKKYGIEDFRPHKLRHTAISIMLDKGIPPHIVAKIAGHSDTNVMYKVYAHADTEGMRAAIEELAKATSL